MTERQQSKPAPIPPQCRAALARLRGEFAELSKQRQAERQRRETEYFRNLDAHGQR